MGSRLGSRDIPGCCALLFWHDDGTSGKVFGLSLPLAEAAEDYPAMDERRDVKMLLRSSS